MRKTGHIRVLLTKSEIDGHDRGVRYVARKLSEAGMEVIYTRYGVPEEIVRTAVDEDVDVIGISFSTSRPIYATAEVIKLLKEEGAEDKSVIVGGIISRDDLPDLAQMGVLGVFGPGSGARDIVECLQAIAARK